ncbi:serine/threonine-protein kinase [Dactylosporangium sp. NPDC049525]|uniref:serine/threonine-protein kinase n=1 Tax=Dactylosporangium sp. NPDC049525 TaxID=3154730 RepID=UPI0034383E9B
MSGVSGLSGVGVQPPVIAGYEFRGRIAGGGHSVVLRYHQVREQRDVAVKVLTLRGAERGASARVVAEANKMAKLSNHGNIVSVFFSAEDGDRPYIVMAYCPGEDLWTLLKRGPFTVRRVLRIGVQIADALQAAHALGIIHRDIKPANILTDEYRNPRLTDFGISVLNEDPGDEDGGIAVSVPWAPPEVLRGEPADTTADIYSLGATLWNLLTGRMPFAVSPARPGDNSPEAMEARILAGRAPRTGRADVPPELEQFLARMLAPAPGSRPAAALDVVRELQRIEAACGGPVRADDPWHQQPTTPAAMPATAPANASVTDNDEALLTRTRIRRPKPAEPGVETRTQRRTAAPPATPVAATEPEEPPRNRRWMLAAAALVLVAGAVVYAAIGGDDPPAERTGQAGQETAPAQDAGAGGDLVPPGIPTVVAERTDPAHLRFTWTYSAPYDSDTFAWQTKDGAKTGVVDSPTVDVEAPAGTEVCVQVRVVRADGGNGTVDWSPAGCGR